MKKIIGYLLMCPLITVMVVGGLGTVYGFIIKIVSYDYIPEWVFAYIIAGCVSLLFMAGYLIVEREKRSR